MKMAATVMMDLSDDQIDQLLAEAESRLAARGPGNSALLPHQSPAVLSAVDTTTPAAPGTTATPVQDQTKQELSVRVLKPVIKEKQVRPKHVAATSLSPRRYDETSSHFQ
jgi:hypothetical protein